MQNKTKQQQNINSPSCPEENPAGVSSSMFLATSLGSAVNQVAGSLYTGGMHVW